MWLQPNVRLSWTPSRPGSTSRRRAPEPATGPTPTAAANPAVTATPNQRDAEGDTTMDSITVAGDEN